LAIYEAAWTVATPFLRRNPRLRDGWDQRSLVRPLPPADIWIQAASVGEAYLARELMEAGGAFGRHRVLATTGTRQGMEILAGDPRWERRFFPLDRPSLMARAADQVRPRAAVLLETELWPGHLTALRSRGVPVLLLNGRITQRSLEGYRRGGGVWRHLRPDRVAAISPADADRFAALFGPRGISVMPNIKFDRIDIPAMEREGASPPSDDRETDHPPWFAPGAPVVVLGSVRQAEEESVLRVLERIRAKNPHAITALVPRHLHRVGAWGERLSRSGIPWGRRSALLEPAPSGTVVVWDTFGELGRLYPFADAVFVGGSLAPLGGQNFMEPLAAGVVPVVGPSISNFAWVGEWIFRRGFVARTRNADEAAAALLAQLRDPPDRAAIRRQVRDFVADRSGGARTAAEMVWEFLSLSGPLREK
jgi:3-deoxy-D-manno-octulosonic-acid transferase